MQIYLRVINPIVAVVVLLLCVWAATWDGGNFRPEGIVRGGFQTYFLAKGLFCSSALFIVGEILSVMIEKGEEPNT